MTLSNLEAHLLLLFCLVSLLCFGLRFMFHEIRAMIDEFDEWRARRRRRRAE